MLYHQNILANVKDGSCFFACSHIFSASTSLFDCFQNLTSQSVRSYHPFPTMPCSDGSLPVTYVDCTEVVTAGSMGSIVAADFPATYCFRKGVCSPIRDIDSPTISITTVLFIIHMLTHLRTYTSWRCTHWSSRTMESWRGRRMASGSTSQV